MATSQKSTYRSQTRVWQRFFGQLSRYDLLLAGIPALFGLSLVVYAVASMPFEVAVGIGAITSCVLLADALYFNPPTDATHSTAQTESGYIDSPERQAAD